MWVCFASERVQISVDTSQWRNIFLDTYIENFQIKPNLSIGVSFYTLYFVTLLLENK